MFNKEKIIEIINQDGIFIDNFILDAFIKNWKIDPIYEDEQGVEYFDELTIEKIKSGIEQKGQPKCEIHVIEKEEEKPPKCAADVKPEETPGEIMDFLFNERKEDSLISKEPEQEVEKAEEPKEEIKETVEVEEKPQETTKEEPAEKIHEPEIISEVKEETAVIPIEVRQKVEGALQNITVDISNQTLGALAESIARKITSDVSEFLKESGFIGEAVHIGELKKDNELLVKKIEELLTDNKILVKRIRELENSQRSYVKLFGNIYVKN